MTTILQTALWLLAAIGAIFVLIIFAAAVLAIQISPDDDGRLVIEGRVPATFREPGSEAQDSSRREVIQ